MISLRIARPEDAAEILAIYRPYIENTAITFDTDVPSVSEYSEHISHILENYPFIVAEENGKIIGYAYASTFRARKAYIYTAETSIYVKDGCHRNGVGLALYDELEKWLTKQNVIILYACITHTSYSDDPNLPEGSIAFHTSAGYKHIGQMENCGYKFGKWYDIVWMEKRLNNANENPNDFISFSKLKA